MEVKVGLGPPFQNLTPKKVARKVALKLQHRARAVGVVENMHEPKLENAFETVGPRERRKDKSDAHEELPVTMLGAFKPFIN